jgi:hypothetical protein
MPAVNTQPSPLPPTYGPKTVQGAIKAQARKQARDAARRPSTSSLTQLPAAEASAELHGEVKEFFEESVLWVDAGRNDTSASPRPVRVIKGSAGVGKSRAFLAQAGDLLNQDPDRRIMICVPTLILADELCVEALASGIQNVRVVRGRQQPLPGGTDAEGPWMCAKAALAKQVGLRHMSVSQTLCYTKGEDGEPDQECEFRATCPYLRQFKGLEGGLLISSHQWLSIPAAVDALKLESIDVLFVDESFWQTLIRVGHVPVGQFLAHRTPGLNFFRRQRGEGAAAHALREQEAGNDFICLLNAMRGILHVAQVANRAPNLDDFRGARITPELAEWAAKVEFSRLRKPDITAGMDVAEQTRLLAETHTEEAYAFAGVWMTLARELAATQVHTTDDWGVETLETFTYTRSTLRGLERRERFYNAKTEQYEDTLLTFSRKQLGMGAIPMCVIDADADTTILGSILPVTKSIEIAAAWQNCLVRQVVDRPVSKSMLAGSSTDPAELARNANRRADLRWMAEDLAARHGMPMAFSARADQDVVARARRPLLIVYKSVEDFWVADGLLEAAGALETPLRNALCFAVAHQGAIRGIDRWKHACGIIVAGRLEPGVRDVEATAKAMFFDAPEEMTFVKAGADGVRWPQVKRCIQLRDGTEQPIDVSVHPDAKVQALLEQMRECEVSQALARIRPVHRATHCEVIIATNVPIPGILVDELVDWADLVPSMMRRAALRGCLPDLAADIAAAHPDMFPSVSAVRDRRARTSAAADSRSPFGGMESDFSRISSNRDKNWGLMTLSTVHFWRTMELRRRRGSALVRRNPGETDSQVIDRLLMFVPDAFDVIVAEVAPPTRRKPAAKKPAVVRLVVPAAEPQPVEAAGKLTDVEPVQAVAAVPEPIQQAEIADVVAMAFANDDEIPDADEQVGRIIRLTLAWLADDLEAESVGRVRVVEAPELPPDPEDGDPVNWDPRTILRASLRVVAGGKTTNGPPPGG